MIALRNRVLQYRDLVLLMGIFCAFLAGHAKAEKQAVNLFGSAFDMNFIEEERDRITFSDDGFLVLAPRRWSSDGYDFSSVLSLDYLRQAFEDSVYSCVEGVQYCEHLPHTHRDRPNKIKIFTSANYLKGNDFLSIEDALYRTLTAVEVDFSFESNPNEATIVFHIGDVNYIRNSMQKNGDYHGLNYLSGELKYSAQPLDLRGLCYLSHKDYSDG